MKFVVLVGSSRRNDFLSLARHDLDGKTSQIVRRIVREVNDSADFSWVLAEDLKRAGKYQECCDEEVITHDQDS